MGNLFRTDVHNNQPNRPGYTQYRNRLWGIIYTQTNMRDVYTAQCEVGGVWEFREHRNYNTRRYNDYCGTIRLKIREHGYRSLIADEQVSSSNAYNVMSHANPEQWEVALQEFNSDAHDRLRSSWMMYLLKNSG